MARVVGPRHPVTVSLTPLGLDLGLAALTVDAVSAGPVWQGGGYWQSDGTARLVCDAAITVPPVTLVIRYTQPGSTALYLASISGTQALVPASWSDGNAGSQIGSAGAWRADGAGNHTGAFGAVLKTAPSTWTPTVAVDGTSTTTTATRTFGADAVTLYVGSYLSGLPMAAGGKIWDVTAYLRSLSAGENTAMADGQINPLTVASDAWGCWDMRNAIDVAGVMKVPDLVLGDGTRDLSQVNGTSARFGAGSFV